MDSERRSLIATAIVGLIVLAIIIGSIYYLVQFIRSRQSNQTASNQQTRSINPSDSASPAVSVNQQSIQPQTRQQTQAQAGDFKTYNEGEYQIVYSKNWGVLTCNNSTSVELDPANAQDQLKVTCDRAQKPVTIIKNSIGCAGGETINLGPHQVVRTKAVEGDFTRYEWCIKSATPLYITHRVSGSPYPASSKDDLSKQIEEMISRISFVRGS
jgi:hypothetical protein